MSVMRRSNPREVALESPTHKEDSGRDAFGRLRRNPSAIAGRLVALFVSVALFAPLLAPQDPRAQDLNLDHLMGAVPARPPRSTWLGVDDLGRDELSRILYGARLSLADRHRLRLRWGMTLG